MKAQRLIFALFATCWAGMALAQELIAVSKPEELGFATERLKRVTETYQGYVESGELPGAVLLIARNDKVALFEAIGFQDREKKIPMKKEAIFRLASMTKPIVSVAVMMLVEEGKLDLIAPVSKYLPEFKDLKVGVETTDFSTGKHTLALEAPRRPMTVQDLLRHTSGLIYPDNGDGLVYQEWQKAKVNDRGQPLSEMVSKMAKLPLAHQPGQVWEYSMSTDVLGRVVEVVSGKDLDVFIAERIAKPLGMASRRSARLPTKCGCRRM
jgi:CubicO group peptidase (beta-lactamase class C family)